jgi:hypothetical protein
MNLIATAAQEEVEAVFGFKAARTGSTFFTDVLTKTVKQTRRPTSMFWEPYCHPRCKGQNKKASDQEEIFHKLLTQKCRGNKCEPGNLCKDFEPSQYGKPIAITAANPRYFNAGVDWNRVFNNLQGIKIFSIRRTNLVLMSYSKYHQGDGCRISKTWLEQTGKFSLDHLLACGEHYSLGNQVRTVYGWLAKSFWVLINMDFFF